MTIIQTVEVNAPTVGMRARLIKALYAAYFAEKMVRLLAAITVAGKQFLARMEREFIMQNIEMEVA